jgi:hypothetical protein
MLFKLLFAPALAPVAGLRFVLKQVLDLAEREVMDVDHLREELLLLNLHLEEGEISEEEYSIQEADIMARLRAAREYSQRSGR